MNVVAYGYGVWGCCIPSILGLALSVLQYSSGHQNSIHGVISFFQVGSLLLSSGVFMARLNTFRSYSMPPQQVRQNVCHRHRKESADFAQSVSLLQPRHALHPLGLLYWSLFSAVCSLWTFSKNPLFGAGIFTLCPLCYLNVHPARVRHIAWAYGHA